MASENDYFDQNDTIGSRLYAVMAEISQCAAEAQTQVDLNDDPNGTFCVIANRLWQLQAETNAIMRDIGVKIPEPAKPPKDDEPVNIPF